MKKNISSSNNVLINNEGIPLPAWSSLLCSYAKKVLDEIKCKNWELSILLCDDKTIKSLNSKYRNKNEPTDVLSFSLGETIQNKKKAIYLPGDIVISLDTLFKNAKYFNIPADQELRRLIIHGILHLKGEDHKTSKMSEPMLVRQEKILKKLEHEFIISDGEKK